MSAASSAAALQRKATEAAAAAAALANPYTRRIAEAIANATNKVGTKNDGSRRKSSDGGDDGDNTTRCSDSGAPFGFLDNMCGPMLRNFNGPGASNDADDLTEATPASRRNRGTRGRPTGSYDYDDETFATDITGSHEDDDETYDDDSRRKGGRGDKRSSRGRDRKPRGRSPIESPTSEAGYSEFDDDTTQNDTVTDASSAYHAPKSSKSKRKNKNDSDAETNNKNDENTKDSEKLITQPLASGFAKRCYFTKAGIGRTTQHYEGLTLTGNTVLMLAAAMKLKGCPTICDEDLRRVEQTYPNQFSRLPDELLLSSGWRRISKYCHFSHKPLPDGVPFFHSRKRCHSNGGFYFLLCSAVGMTRLMDVEPLNRDALAVLQTDYPMTCEKAPKLLMGDPNEWTLVNKFCFFSGGPINVEEDVYYRAELGGTEIYMLAFLSPSLSPEELYRLKPNKGGMGEDAGPLKSIAAVEEVESVYDLTERDFDDLKLYHLGPCRALPPYLLHPETWTKVLPPHFMTAREEALTIAQDWESRFPPALGTQSGETNTNNPPEASVKGESAGSGYVELGGGGGRPPQSTRSGMVLPPGGPALPPQYPGGPGMSTPMSQQPQQPGGDPNAGFYPSQGGMDQQASGFPPQSQQQQYGAPPTPQQQMEGEMNYYYGAAPSQGQGVMQHGAATPSPQFGQQHHMNMPPPQNPYGAPNDMMPQGAMNQMSGPYDPNQQGPYDQQGYDQQGYDQQGYDQQGGYGAPPQQMIGDPNWMDVHEEGAFGMGMVGGDQPADEAMYGGEINGVAPGMGGYPIDGGQMMDPGMMDQMQHHQGMEPDDNQYHHDDEQYNDQYGRHQEDPPDADTMNNMPPRNPYTMGGDDTKSVQSGTSSLMGGAQNRLKQNRMKKMKEKSQRPDLSTKLGANKFASPGVGDDSTWDTRTDGESSYGTSLASESTFTDTTNPNERNSRRALILQMAKARMKNVKEQTTAVERNAEVEQGQQEEGDVNLDAPQDELVDEVAGLELD